ncbi:MAG: sulfotransferase family protein, partial [Bacillota bacterium]
GEPKEYLYSLYGMDYAEIFMTIMNQYANKKNAKYWLEKTPPHSLKINLLYKVYPDAYFIIIKRNLVDYLKSSFIYKNRIPVRKRNRIKKIRSLIFHYHIYNKILNLFSRTHNTNRVFVIKYEDLLLKNALITSKLFSFLNISTGKKIVSAYKANTSYVGKNKNQRIFSKKELRCIRFYNALFKLIPGYFYIVYIKLTEKIKHFFIEHGRNELPEWFFKTKDLK